MALYHDFAPQQESLAKARVWSYPSPTPSFTQIKDYLCFYASSSTDPNTIGGWTCVSAKRILIDVNIKSDTSLISSVC